MEYELHGYFSITDEDLAEILAFSLLQEKERVAFIEGQRQQEVLRQQKQQEDQARRDQEHDAATAEAKRVRRSLRGKRAAEPVAEYRILLTSREMPPCEPFHMLDIAPLFLFEVED